MRSRLGFVPAARAGQKATPARNAGLKLAVAALGVVYGDIGTSPLYAMKECFTPPHGVAADTSQRARRPLARLLGAHAGRHRQVPDVHHAGGQQRRGRHPRAPRARSSPKRRLGRTRRHARWLVSCCSASSARRCSTATASSRRPSPSSARSRASRSRRTRLDPVVVPLTVAILFGALPRAEARHGEHRRASSARSCSSGSRRSSRSALPLDRAAPGRPPGGRPAPRRRASSSHNGGHGFLVLGARRPLHHRRRGALRGHGPLRPRRRSGSPGTRSSSRRSSSTTSGRARSISSAARACTNPFYELVRRLAALPDRRRSRPSPTVIASQALISGAFSLTRQAVQLGYCPRVTVIHTSGNTEGQIYMPEVN